MLMCAPAPWRGCVDAQIIGDDDICIHPLGSTATVVSGGWDAACFVAAPSRGGAGFELSVRKPCLDARNHFFVAPISDSLET